MDECPAEKNGTGRVAPDIAEDLCAVADSRDLRCRLRVRWRGISRSAGLAEDEPAAYALINTMRLDEDQIGGLELAIDKAEDPQKGSAGGSKRKSTGSWCGPGSEPLRTRRRSK